MKPPTQEELRAQAQRELKNRFGYWKMFIVGLAVLSEETVANANPFELMILDEVFKYREEYLDNRIVKSELVERKR